jgi:hypothetical protein
MKRRPPAQALVPKQGAYLLVVFLLMVTLIEPDNRTKPLLHGWRPSGLPSLPPEPDIPAGKPSVSRARSAPILIIPQWRCPVSSYRRECSQRTLLDEMNGG